MPLFSSFQFAQLILPYLSCRHVRCLQETAPKLRQQKCTGALHPVHRAVMALCCMSVSGALACAAALLSQILSGHQSTFSFPVACSASRRTFDFCHLKKRSVHDVACVLKPTSSNAGPINAHTISPALSLHLSGPFKPFFRCDHRDDFIDDRGRRNRSLNDFCAFRRRRI